MSGSAARLEVVAGKATGMSIVVEDELLIGRHAAGAGRLAEDEEISRTHARVTLEQSGFCAIEDLGSTNGTYVNGLRIASPQTLSVGDTIEMGDTTLVVREVPDPRAPAAQASPGRQPTVVPPPGGPTPVPGMVAEAQAPAEGPAPTKLSLRLEVDFDAREALVFIDEASEPVRVRYDAGAWRQSEREGDGE